MLEIRDWGESPAGLSFVTELLEDCAARAEEGAKGLKGRLGRWLGKEE